MRNITLTLALTLISLQGIGQCAMCKAVVESDQTQQGAGINAGIIFLIVVVYCLLFFGFKNQIASLFRSMKGLYKN